MCLINTSQDAFQAEPSLLRFTNQFVVAAPAVSPNINDQIAVALMIVFWIPSMRLNMYQVLAISTVAPTMIQSSTHV